MAVCDVTDRCAVFFRQDGVFLLRIIGGNTSKLVVREIIAQLWQNWRHNICQDATPVVTSELPLLTSSDDDLDLEKTKLNIKDAVKPVIAPKPSVFRRQPSAPQELV